MRETRDGLVRPARAAAEGENAAQRQRGEEEHRPVGEREAEEDPVLCVQKPVTMNIDGHCRDSQLTVISSRVGSPKPHSMACCGAYCIQLWLIAVASPPSAASVTNAPHTRCPRGKAAPHSAKAPTSMYMKR